MIMKFRQAIHYIYFLFSCEYVHIMLLIWPETGIMFTCSFNFTSWYSAQNQYIYQCQKQPVSTPTHFFIWLCWNDAHWNEYLFKKIKNCINSLGFEKQVQYLKTNILEYLRTLINQSLSYCYMELMLLI